MVVKSRSVKRNTKNARGLWRDRAAFSLPPPPPFASRASLIFALLVLIRPTILSESLAQATQFRAKCLNLHGHRLWVDSSSNLRRNL